MPGADILMVDDNHTLRKVVQRYLGERGLDIVTVATAAAAGQVLARQPPRMLLVDMQLPDAHGLELVRRYAARGLTVIAVTADSSPRCERELRRAGAAACLIKPFTLPALAEAVDRALARPAPR